MSISILVISLLGLATPPPKSTPAMLEKGKAAFATSCAACHGEKGDGTGPAAAAFNPKPRNFITEALKSGNKPEQVFKVVSEGLTGTAMPPFGHLSEEDRWAIAHYVLSLQKLKKTKNGK